MSGFCQFKTAFLLGEGFEKLSSHVCEGSIFDAVENEKLPLGWELRGTDISGAAGFLLIFDIEGIPIQDDLNAAEQYLKQLEAA